jgi:hypothetical protein
MMPRSMKFITLISVSARMNSSGPEVLYIFTGLRLGERCGEGRRVRE